MKHRCHKKNSELSTAVIDDKRDRGGRVSLASLRDHALGNSLIIGNLPYAWE